jgi:uncharacterized protein (TIGR04255 family)
MTVYHRTVKGNGLSEFEYRAPPINEIALSVSMQSAGVFDPFNVKSLHDKFVSEFPIVERQNGIATLEVARLHGGGCSDALVAPQRWFFASYAGNDLIQVQDELLSYNWRRLAAPLNAPLAYPGYNSLRNSAKSAFESAMEWNRGSGRSTPTPAGCELLYDNLIPLVPNEHGALNLSSVLATLHDRPYPLRIANWNWSWMEAIGDTGVEDRSSMNVVLAVGAVVDPSTTDGTSPVLRMTFSAGAARDTWEDVFSFFDTAHAHIRNRFEHLLTPEVRATWR